MTRLGMLKNMLQILLSEVLTTIFQLMKCILRKIFSRSQEKRDGKVGKKEIWLIGWNKRAQQFLMTPSIYKKHGMKCIILHITGLLLFSPDR